MCGIIGIGGFRDDNLVQRMNQSIIHRGPDDKGYFYSINHSLGMRRLSIIDLQTGHQPMFACEKKVAIVFNGEIYNYKEIRALLEDKGHVFRSQSDTETILLGYIEWGLNILDKLNGMFSIAISDNREKPVLYLIRDRLGVKPLYYHFEQGRLTFGSEIKAVLKNERINRQINPWALHHYFKLRYVPGNDTLIKGLCKLPAGCWLRFLDNDINITNYWSPTFPEKKRKINYYEASEGLKEKLEKAIKRRLVSDVPVGAYLSGGLDSSVIAALMAKFHSGPINTFTIGFNSANDETHQALETARYLGTDHHEIYCNDKDFEDLEKIVWHLDEPIGDAIVLPMYLLAKEARKHVKVILAGEGADEIFGGYLFHKTLNAVSRYKGYIPRHLRMLIRSVFRKVPHGLINCAFQYPANLGESGKKKLTEFLVEIENKTSSEQYRSLISLYSDTELSTLYHPQFKTDLKNNNNYFAENIVGGASNLDFILGYQYRDWLPDDILMKLDKMTMAHSLEGRVPFLDHELVNYVNGLPDHYKIRGWKDKFILRQYAKDILPSQNARRPKIPFYIPMDEYFKKPTFSKLLDQFREENYLDGILQPELLSKFDGSTNNLIESKQLFSMMILNLWIKNTL